MTEPADLWVQRLDRKYRDNAPRVVRNEKTTGPAYLFVGPGIHPLAVAAAFAAGKSGQELREHMNHGYEAARPGGWDPVERLKDQDLDGVVAEVLYSTLGIAVFNVNDIELQLACLRVYNDWLAEFCAHDPHRLVGVGLYSLAALPDVGEVERCAKIGLKGLMVLASDSNDLPYSDPRFDPLWRAASANGLPISLPSTASPLRAWGSRLRPSTKRSTTPSASGKSRRCTRNSINITWFWKPCPTFRTIPPN